MTADKYVDHIQLRFKYFYIYFSFLNRNHEENMERGQAPENLSFKDRQRLFSSSQLPQ